MSFNFIPEDSPSLVRQYMETINKSSYVFVHHNDITFAAYAVDDTTISVSQIEVRVHPGVQIDSSFIEEGANVPLLMILSLVYEAELDPQISENEHDLDNLHSSYRVLLNRLTRNSFFAIEHKDRWGDYIDPFLFELADAILRRSSIFSSLIYNLGFKIEWVQEKISKLTWFPLHLSSK